MNILCAAAALTGVTRRPGACRLITPRTLAEWMAPSDAALVKGRSGGWEGEEEHLVLGLCQSNSLRP